MLVVTRREIFFFIGGTKSSDYAGCTAVGQSVQSVGQINASASVFTAELLGFLLIADKIIKQKYRLSVIFSDWLSSLVALNAATSWKHPIVSFLRAKRKKCCKAKHHSSLLLAS